MKHFVRRPGSRRRVAFLNSHPIQYFTPLYAYLNRSEDIEAVPIFMSDFSVRGAMDPGFGTAVRWDIDLLAGFDPVFLPGAAQRGMEPGLLRMLVPQVWREIRTGGYDALVFHGHGYGANHVAMLAAKSTGIPVFHRCETHLGLPRSSLKAIMRTLSLSPFYAMLDGVLAIGSANRAFYQAMGVPDRKIHLFPYSVDNERFIASSTLGPDERAAMRARLGLSPDRPAVLYLSKFQRRKHPDDLIRAAQQVAAEGLELDVVIAGAGEMEGELRALAASADRPNILFPGFFNQSELPRLLGACDIFALPSENEPWGLIINEAMCAGLPILASREIGSVPDLLRDGENGYAFDARDVGALAAALRTLVADPDLRTRMGAASRNIIEGWSYRECLAGLREALQASELPIAR